MLQSVDIILGENVVVATITAFGVILAALLGYLGVVATGARRHAKAARFEVQNSHETNLRDDLDEKFKGLETQLITMGGTLKTAVSDIGGLRSEMRDIRREALVDRQATAAERERTRHLEDTLTPAQLKRVRNENKE